MAGMCGEGARDNPGLSGAVHQRGDSFQPGAEELLPDPEPYLTWLLLKHYLASLGTFLGFFRIITWLR